MGQGEPKQNNFQPQNKGLGIMGVWAKLITGSGGGHYDDRGNGGGGGGGGDDDDEDFDPDDYR